jgi:hypothetical protein
MYRTARFNTKKLCILPTQSVYVFRVILGFTINSLYSDTSANE